MQTRKYPRTLTEAFGPYTSNGLQPMAEREDTDYPWTWWTLLFSAAIVGIAVIVVTA